MFPGTVKLPRALRLNSTSIPYVAGILGLLLTIVTATAGTTKLELPPAPGGFSWKQLPEIKAAFLVPDGWHFGSEKQGGTLAYFVTPGKFDRQAGFATGLTINVFKRMRDRDAIAYARDFIAQLAAKHELVKQWETAMGEMQGYGCQVKMAAEGKYPASRTHYLAIASKTTNTLYILFFEAPEDEWQSAWEKGQKMLEVFVVDNEV